LSRSKIVPDTSALVNQLVSAMIERGEIRDTEVIVPLAALDELQAMASKGRVEGVIGLREIKRIRETGAPVGVEVRFTGERPSLEDIKLARGGRIDALIRDVAKREGATLYTSDYIQYLVAEAENLPAKHFQIVEPKKDIPFERFLTEETVSLHLKVGAPPMAKVGAPGRLRLVKLREDPLTREEAESIISSLMWTVKHSEEAVMEIARVGATVIQLGQYRISITRPPFSDDVEITVVRPLVKLSIHDYGLSEKLLKRLSTKAEGILVAGPPGSGKTTFASSLAEYYWSLGKIVKTFESPRDLQVGPEITQLAPLEGDFEKSAEILLLIRPDFTIFDEMRKPKDFQVFIDMRFSGVGMVGVIHASDPIDAIQRFIPRAELGMLPYIIDTVIFIREGRVDKVYELRQTVRIPWGMTERDLARPIVEVVDLESSRLEYEIYTFGDQITIVQVHKESPPRGGLERGVKTLERLLKRIAKSAVVSLEDERVVVKCDRDDLQRLATRYSNRLKRMEERLGIRIDLEPLVPALGGEVDAVVNDAGGKLEIVLQGAEEGDRVSVYVGEDHILTATVGRGKKIRLSKRSEAGAAILKQMILAGGRPRVFKVS